MNEKVLESFINTCDEMMVPVQEDLKTIKRDYTEVMEKIKNIKEKMKEEDNIAKIINLNNECIKELDKYYNLISSDKGSEVGKVERFSALIVSAFSLLGVRVSQMTRGIMPNLSSITAGASVLGLIGSLVCSARVNKKHLEGRTKYIYQTQIKELKTAISLANDTLKEAKRLNINSYSDLSKNYNIEFDNQKPVITKK